MELFRVTGVDAVSITLPGISGNDAVILTGNGHDGPRKGKKKRRTTKINPDELREPQILKEKEKEELPSIHGVRIEAVLNWPGGGMALWGGGQVHVVQSLHWEN